MQTLDQTIDFQADVLRRDPEKLKAQQGVTPDLLKALATQKALTQQQAAERELSLSMGNNPATVVQQNENNLVEMNKNELAAQTAGIMGQRQQKAVQKGQAMGMPPAQSTAPQNLQAGIAGQPRPNMQAMGMAQGGIIGYADGKEVEAKGSLQVSDELLAILDMDRTAFDALPPNVQTTLVKDAEVQQQSTKAKENISQANAPIAGIGEAIKKGLDAIPAAENESRKRAAEKELGISGEAPEQTTGLDSAKSAQPAAINLGPAPDSLSGIGGKTLADGSIGFDSSAVPTTGGGIPTLGADKNAAMQGTQAATAPTASIAGSTDARLKAILDTPGIDTSGINKKQVTSAMGDKFNTALGARISDSPEARAKQETARLSGPARKEIIGPDGKPTGKFEELGGFDREKKAEGLAKYLADKEALDKEQYNPDTLAKKRNDAYMTGLMTGGTGGTGVAAQAKFDSEYAAARNKSIADQKAMFMEDMTFDVEIADKISTQTNKLLDIYKKDVASGMNTAVALNAADMEAFYKEAKMMYDTNQDGIKNKIDAVKIQTEANLQKLIKEQASFKDIAATMNSFLKTQTEMLDNISKPFLPELATLASELEKTKTPEERRAVQAKIDQINGLIRTQMELTEIDDSIKIVKRLLEAVGKNNGYSSTIIQEIRQQLENKRGSSVGYSSTNKNVSTGSSSGGASTGASGLPSLSANTKSNYLTP
tara:strand:+ start:2778 stop:4910 length:2133 start_codon:yes stop_codon:yes gene_type:complete